jgi:hypothetical protein
MTVIVVIAAMCWLIVNYSPRDPRYLRRERRRLRTPKCLRDGARC